MAKRIKPKRGMRRKKDEQMYGVFVARTFENFLYSLLQDLGYAVHTRPLGDGVVEAAANLTMTYVGHIPVETEEK